MPKYSIIIPAFNKENYIGETLKSCLQQTDGDWEAIVIDDKSTDGTVDVVKKMMAKDSRIKLVCQKKRQGPSIARNVGLKLAKGKYINYLDADDIIEPQKLELQGAILDKRKKIGIVLSEGLTIDGKGRVLNPNHTTMKAFNGHPRLQELLFRGGWFPPAIMLCRRELAVKVGGFWPEGFWCEDLEFFIRLARAGMDYYVVPQKLYRYRKLKGSWGGNVKRMIKGNLATFAKLMREDPEESAKGLVFVQNRVTGLEFELAQQRILLKKIVACLTPKLRSIMIWGAGSGGRRVLALFNHLGIKVSAFIDRDPAKIGAKIEDLEVYSPEDFLKKMKQERPFVVIGTMFFEPVEEQLLEAGWLEEKDFHTVRFDINTMLEETVSKEKESGLKQPASNKTTLEAVTV